MMPPTNPNPWPIGRATVVHGVVMFTRRDGVGADASERAYAPNTTIVTGNPNAIDDPSTTTVGPMMLAWGANQRAVLAEKAARSRRAAA